MEENEEKSNLAQIIKYKLTNVFDPEIGYQPNATSIIFTPGFTSENDDLEKYLKHFVNARKYSEIKGVNWKASFNKELAKDFFFKFEKACDNHFVHTEEVDTFTEDWQDEIAKCISEEGYLKKFISIAKFAIKVKKNEIYFLDYYKRQDSLLG